LAEFVQQELERLQREPELVDDVSRQRSLGFGWMLELPQLDYCQWDFEHALQQLSRDRRGQKPHHRSFLVVDESERKSLVRVRVSAFVCLKPEILIILLLHHQATTTTSLSNLVSRNDIFLPRFADTNNHFTVSCPDIHRISVSSILSRSCWSLCIRTGSL
jgi:hypothetical protein